MLQYSVQLPPLSLTSSKPKKRSTAQIQQSLSASKRMDKRSPAYAHTAAPLSISTAFHPPSSPSLPSSSLSSPSLPPTPSFPSSGYPFPSTSSPLSTPSMLPKHVSRSPYVASATLPVNVPGTRSPHPLKSTPLPSSGLSSPSLGHSALGAVSSGGSYPRSASSTRSSFSSSVLDVLSPGDLIGEGLDLQGQPVRRVPYSPLPSPQSSPSDPGSPPSATVAVPPLEEPAQTFEVVKRLGTGSYAVVYLVREVLYRAPETEHFDYDGSDLDMSMDGHSEFGADERDSRREAKRENEYGREYAVKLLSKANLDEEALSAQMFEATIHQSLPAHPNIVTLHRTLETPSFLLLLLEFVPGEDLFYFLEQARDHYEPTPSTSPAEPGQSPSDSGCSVSSAETARTPPTPSLLSNLSPSKLLSRTRLKLIASMFSQMCDAVATCHERGVFHRDIKPENFIVTDGFMDVRVPAPSASESEEKEIVMRERRVVVKLTDFGLSTTDMHSADMDCGSAPYMSYECRNNIHPTYMPRAADVWSLGIVLINMLYHYNPWTDTTEGVCTSFYQFRQNPTNFFLTRFSGMTPVVADFLANRVFCILSDPMDDSARVSARAFGQWVRDLPNLLSPQPSASRPGSAGVGHMRSSSFTINISEVYGHRLASIPHSRRPSLRSVAGSRNPSLLANQRASWTLSRAPSYGIAPEEHVKQHMPSGVGLGVSMQEVEEEPEQELIQDQDQHEQESGSRSASHNKRRKRGARKGKGSSVPPSSPTPQDQTLETLASASQALAREISRQSRSNSTTGVTSPLSSTRSGFNPAEQSPTTPVATVPVPAPAPPAPTITKKPSKWKLGFGKSSSSSNPPPPPPPAIKEDGLLMSSTASNVTNLIMGLNAPSTQKTNAAPRTSPYLHPQPPPSSSSFASSQPPSRYAPASANSSMVSLDDPAYARGRKYRAGPAGNTASSLANDISIGMWGASTVSGFANSAHGSSGSDHGSLLPPSSSHSFSPASSSSSDALSLSAALARQRGVSPASAAAASGVSVSASASQVSVMSASTASSNWRSSMASSAATSTSAFTRYSNGSVRSVSTTATSVSNASWRSGTNKSSLGTTVTAANGRDVRLPPNVKLVYGEPWELSELPRQMYPDPDKVTFSQPPQRKRAQKPKNSNLDTISERPANAISTRADASTSTTDLDRVVSANNEDDGSGSPRKVQKGQINALAKMLSALRR